MPLAALKRTSNLEIFFIRNFLRFVIVLLVFFSDKFFKPLCQPSFRICAFAGRILSIPPVGERTAPHPALSPSDGERGEDPLAAGSRAASHPSPLSIGWREGEEGLRGGWRYRQDTLGRDCSCACELP